MLVKTNWFTFAEKNRVGEHLAFSFVTRVQLCLLYVVPNEQQFKMAKKPEFQIVSLQVFLESGIYKCIF